MNSQYKEKGGALLTVECISSIDRWIAFEADWKELLSRSKRTEVFLSHQWLTSWYRYFGERNSLHVLIVKEGTQLIGGVPFVKIIENWHGVSVRTLRFPINQESGNLRCDFVLSTRQEETVSALIRHLAETAHQWNRLELSGLPVTSPTFSMLHPAIEKAGWSKTFWKFERALYYLPIDKPWVTFLKERSYNFKRNIKRSENRMQGVADAKIQEYRLTGEALDGIRAIFEIEQRSTKANRPGVVRLEGKVRAFNQSLAESFGQSRDCWLEVLKIGEMPVAGIMFLCNRHTLFGAITCYDPISHELAPGRLLFKNLYETAWNERLSEIDFNGNTPFVQSWANHCRSTLACTLYSPTLRSRLINFWEQTVSPTLHRAGRKTSILPLTPLPTNTSRKRNVQPTNTLHPFQHPSCLYYQDGRTALDCGLEALPLCAGDEVLFPAYHCGTELEVLIKHGFKLRFYPVSIDLAISLETLQQFLTKHTKAIYIIHYLGWTQDIALIANFCRDHHLLLIEDCAQTLYGADPNRPSGQHGDLAIFSLHKFLPLQDGGAAVFNRIPANQPKNGAPPSWKDLVGTHIHHLILRHQYSGGWRSAFSELSCRMLSAIAKRLGFATYTPLQAMTANSRNILQGINHQHVINNRRANYLTLLKLFEGKQGMNALFPTLDEAVVPLLFPIMIEHPPPFLLAMELAGIEACMLWASVHPTFLLDEFQDVVYLKSHLVVLPVHQELTHADLLKIESAVDCYNQNRNSSVITDSAA